MRGESALRTTKRKQPRQAPISHATAKPHLETQPRSTNPIPKMGNTIPGNNLNPLKQPKPRVKTRKVPNPLPEKNGNKIDPNLIEKPKRKALLSNTGPGNPNVPIPAALACSTAPATSETKVN